MPPNVVDLGRERPFHSLGYPYMVTVRQATATDLNAMQVIYSRSIAEADWLPPSAKLKPVFADVSVGERVHVAVASSGAVVGLVSVQEPESFIHHLYVHPDARRDSVGTALLASLTAWLPMPWRLKCVRQNLGALGFYLTRGWCEVGSGASDHGPYAVLSFHQGPSQSAQGQQP